MSTVADTSSEPGNTAPASVLELKVPGYDRIFVRRDNERDVFVVVEVLLMKSYKELTVYKGDAVLDVGAHIGTFAVWLGGDPSRVVCIERDPAALALLRMNSGSAPNSKVMFVRRTVSDSSSGENISIDDLAAELGVRFNVMKIDVEGDEVKALKGASRTLRELREVIVEAHNASLLREVVTILQSAGLEVKIVEGHGFGRFSAIRFQVPLKVARLMRYGRHFATLVLLNGGAVTPLVLGQMRMFFRHFDLMRRFDPRAAEGRMVGPRGSYLVHGRRLQVDARGSLNDRARGTAG